MTRVDVAELRRLAEAAKLRDDCNTPEGWAFIAAASPDAILSLLREVELLRKLEDEVRASVEITNYVLGARKTDKLLDELDELEKQS